MITVANIHDGQAALQLMRVLKNLWSSVKVILADSGYRGEIIEQIKRNFDYLLQITLRTDRNIFQIQPKRWVIERTFSWFDNDRRLCRHYELLMETAEEMVKLSAIKLLLSKI